MKTSSSDLFWTFIRIFVGIIFAYAGWSKLAEPAANFEAALLKYGVFSPFWIPWLARILPWTEWLLGAFLIVGYAPRLTAWGTCLLSLGFLVSLTSSRLFLESGGTDCGCFGRSWFHLSVRQIFFVDLVNFALALRLGLIEDHPWSLHSFLLKRTGAGDDTKDTRKYP